MRRNLRLSRTIKIGGAAANLKITEHLRAAQVKKPRPVVFRFHLGFWVIIYKIKHTMGFSCFR